MIIYLAYESVDCFLDLTEQFSWSWLGSLISLRVDQLLSGAHTSLWVNWLSAGVTWLSSIYLMAPSSKLTRHVLLVKAEVQEQTHRCFSCLCLWSQPMSFLLQWQGFSQHQRCSLKLWAAPPQKEGDPSNVSPGAKPFTQLDSEIWPPKEILQKESNTQKISNTKATPASSPSSCLGLLDNVTGYINLFFTCNGREEDFYNHHKG